MRHGSLFSGIGGFDLAAEWMGWENVFHCEWNEFGQRVLKYYWPKAKSYDDITKTDFTIHRGRIDIISGGFPCQPYSQAGKRLGKEDDRHLWPEMLRAIQEIQPTWVVGENVLGIVNWNDGLVFDEVQADLEAQGYEVQTYVLPAAGVNAPHQRYRTWFIAHSKNNGCSRGDKLREETRIQERSIYKCEGERRDEIWPKSERYSEGGIATDSECLRDKGKRSGERRVDRPVLEKTKRNKEAEQHFRRGRNGITTNANEFRESQDNRQGESRFNLKESEGCYWHDFPTIAPILSRNDGLSSELDGITFPKWRNESIKAYGNAIVPQVALQIFKAIEEYKKL